MKFCVCPCCLLNYISDPFNSLSLVCGYNICILATYLSPVSKNVSAPDFCVVLHKYCHVIMWQYSYVQTQNPEEWPIIEPLPSYGRGRERLGGRHISLIHGDGLTNVVITGMWRCIIITIIIPFGKWKSFDSWNREMSGGCRFIQLYHVKNKCAPGFVKGQDYS